MFTYHTHTHTASRGYSFPSRSHRVTQQPHHHVLETWPVRPRPHPLREREREGGRIFSDLTPLKFGTYRQGFFLKKKFKNFLPVACQTV